MNILDTIENNKMIKLSDSNRYIIEQALITYKNISVYQNNDDEYLEIQDLEIDEIIEKIKD